MKLVQAAYFSNFETFDRRASQALLILMTSLQKPLKVSAGGLFRIELSISTFLQVSVIVFFLLVRILPMFVGLFDINHLSTFSFVAPDYKNVIFLYGCFTSSSK